MALGDATSNRVCTHARIAGALAPLKALLDAPRIARLSADVRARVATGVITSVCGRYQVGKDGHPRDSLRAMYGLFTSALSYVSHLILSIPCLESIDLYWLAALLPLATRWGHGT